MPRNNYKQIVVKCIRTISQSSVFCNQSRANSPQKLQHQSWIYFFFLVLWQYFRVTMVLTIFTLFTGYLLSRGSNTNCLCFKIISHQAPIYLSELLCLYTPSWQLHSSTETRVFRIPSINKAVQKSLISEIIIIMNT